MTVERLIEALTEMVACGQAQPHYEVVFGKDGHARKVDFASHGKEVTRWDGLDRGTDSKKAHTNVVRLESR